MAVELSEKKKQEGWQVVKFGQIAKEVKKTTKDPFEDGLQYYVGLEHIDPQSSRIQRRGIIAEDNPTFNKRFYPGQILFGRRRAYLKKAAVADFEGICSGDITVIEGIPGMIIPALLPFIVQSDMFFDWAVKNSAGGLSPRVKWKYLAAFEFPFPPLERQEEILQILKKIDECITYINDIYLKAEKLLKIIRYSLLSYGIKKNNLKESTSKWVEKKFKNFATLQRGFDLPEQKREPGEFPIYASTNIVGKHNEYMVEAPGVITGRSGTIGRVAYSEQNYWPLNTVLFVKDFHGNLPKFVKYFLESFHLERFATGTGVPTLNRNIVHKEKIKFPPIEEQKVIVIMLDKLEKVISDILARESNYFVLRSKVFNCLWEVHSEI